MKIKELRKREAQEFYLATPDDTFHFGKQIGLFLRGETEAERASLIRTIGFQTQRIGKSTCIRGIKHGLGENELYETHLPGEQQEQNLTYFDSVGWVRHYDIMLESEVGHLQARLNREFWKQHGYGLEIVENSYENDRDCDMIFKLKHEGAPKYSENEVKEMTYKEKLQIPRKIMLFADPKYDNNPAYQALLERVREEFPMPRALQPEPETAAEPL